MKYLIIGLGHYGATLAMELTAMGHEVVGADGNGLHVDSVKDRMAASFVLDATDEMALSVLPLKSVDAVIVAIGDNFGASVRIVSLLKKLKVKRIYARAVDEVHKGVLEAFSIDRILTPEQDAARLLAQQLELDGATPEMKRDRLSVFRAIPFLLGFCGFCCCGSCGFCRCICVCIYLSTSCQTGT